jgi:3-isopropylmalate dehydrogenase
LSDLGGATVGGIAGCPSGNIGENCAYFEPIHGSAPSIAGTNTANPRGQMLAAAIVLDYLGETAAGDALREAVDGAFGDGSVETLPDGRVVRGANAVADRVVERLAVRSTPQA